MPQVSHAPQSKSDQVRLLVSQHKWKEALRLASTFRLGLSDEDRKIIGRAWASYTQGYMLEQMKRDPEQCRMAGIRLLKEKYGVRCN